MKRENKVTPETHSVQLEIKTNRPKKKFPGIARIENLKPNRTRFNTNKGFAEIQTEFSKQKRPSQQCVHTPDNNLQLNNFSGHEDVSE